MTDPPSPRAACLSEQLFLMPKRMPSTPHLIIPNQVVMLREIMKCIIMSDEVSGPTAVR